MTRRRIGQSRISIATLMTLVVSILILAGCGEIPTTITLNVFYELPSSETTPADYALPPSVYVYWRLMTQDGTVVYSNESNPRIVTGLSEEAGSNMVWFLIEPPDSALLEATDTYILDAYVYDNPFAGTELDPALDPQRLTMAPDENLSSPPFYLSDSHVKVDLRLTPGDQKQAELIVQPDYSLFPTDGT